ncbi:MAG: formylglycine-generating enzyme family protein [Saprospiraceae bacterium]|nr:formylglycine-generating enzyme family protein [Saprospiraceae bacterium]
MKCVAILSICFLAVTWGYTQDFEPYNQGLHGVKEFISMVPIPRGQMQMGDARSKESDEKPVKEVMLPAFWMSAMEITHDVFMVFRDPEIDLDENDKPRVDGVTRPSAPYEDPVFGMGKDGYPAAGMTQFAALQFCKWLSEKTGHFYRLPTEAEWEYACRAGSEKAYFFGKKKKDLKLYAWYDRNSKRSFHQVGQLQPNPWGLYDILGNVAEWTLDQYDPLAYGSINEEEENPWTKPTALHPRTVRGGSFGDEAVELRCANRTSSSEEWKKRDPQIPKSFWWNTDSPFVGFRLVRPAITPSDEEQKAFWAIVLGG